MGSKSYKEESQRRAFKRYSVRLPVILQVVERSGSAQLSSKFYGITKNLSFGGGLVEATNIAPAVARVLEQRVADLEVTYIRGDGSQLKPMRAKIVRTSARIDPAAATETYHCRVAYSNKGEPKECAAALDVAFERLRPKIGKRRLFYASAALFLACFAGAWFVYEGLARLVKERQTVEMERRQLKTAKDRFQARVLESSRRDPKPKKPKAPPVARPVVVSQANVDLTDASLTVMKDAFLGQLTVASETHALRIHIRYHVGSDPYECAINRLPVEPHKPADFLCETQTNSTETPVSKIRIFVEPYRKPPAGADLSARQTAPSHKDRERPN